MNGSRTCSPLNVYSWMNRLGSATGNGAGWSTRLADSGGISQTERVEAKNSSAVMSLSPLTTRSKRPLEKHRQYSCTSDHRVGRRPPATPGAVAARPPGLLPDHLSPHEEADLQHLSRHVMGKRDIRAPSQVGHVDHGPAPRLQDPVGLG